MYKVSHNINVTLTDAKTGKVINTVSVPVMLNVRHADFDRTWTEISWLEFGVIAFVGGIVFISYDDDVTPLVQQKAGPVISDYVARQIASGLSGFKTAIIEKSPAVTIPPTTGESAAGTKLEQLNVLKEKGLISDEEYQIKRKAIVDAL